MAQEQLSSKPSLYKIKTSGPTPHSPTGPHPHAQQSIFLETRLFYVRISPCITTNLPNHLTLRHLRRTTTTSSTTLEINGTPIPSSSSPTSLLRRDRVSSTTSEVTFVSTDTIRLSSSPLEFEILEENNDSSQSAPTVLLCGSLERYESKWNLDCHAAMNNSSAFFQPKLGVSSPSIEVYIAGRCADLPVILTKTVVVSSPRKKVNNHRLLSVIPEGDYDDDIQIVNNNKVAVGEDGHRKLQLIEADDDYDTEGKIQERWYPEGFYEGEDGQLTWFNAGVRVGVGIGLGMCLGLGIGVGLLMRSYQTTTRNFKRRFL